VRRTVILTSIIPYWICIILCRFFRLITDYSSQKTSVIVSRTQMNFQGQHHKPPAMRMLMLMTLKQIIWSLWMGLHMSQLARHKPHWLLSRLRWVIRVPM
jgi:hypothetical protein